MTGGSTGVGVTVYDGVGVGDGEGSGVSVSGDDVPAVVREGDTGVTVVMPSVVVTTIGEGVGTAVFPAALSEALCAGVGDPVGSAVAVLQPAREVSTKTAVRISAEAVMDLRFILFTSFDYLRITLVCGGMTSVVPSKDVTVSKSPIPISADIFVKATSVTLFMSIVTASVDVLWMTQTVLPL